MPNELVIAGPYRWVRNPMAVAGVAQAASVGLILGSWLVVVYAVGGALLWNVGIRPWRSATSRRGSATPTAGTGSRSAAGSPGGLWRLAAPADPLEKADP